MASDDKKRETQQNSRPLLTYCLLSYRQEPYIRKAVEGALAQTYQPLEILLSDDASPDSTFDIMRQAVASRETPHKVVLNRNEKNLGLCRHVNRVLGMASGEILIMAAGDDISMPSRVEKTWRIFACNTDVGAVSFRLRSIDEKGTRGNLFLRGRDREGKFTISDYISGKKFIPHGASAAYRKNIVVDYGSLNIRCQVEDVPLMTRVLMRGFSVYHSAAEEVLYRVHGANLSLGDGGFRLDYRRICYQQLTDLKFATASGWVSQKDSEKVRKRIGCDFQQRRIHSGFHKSNKKFKYFINQILCSKQISLRHKRRYFRSVVRSALK